MAFIMKYVMESSLDYRIHISHTYFIRYSTLSYGEYTTIYKWKCYITRTCVYQLIQSKTTEVTGLGSYLYRQRNYSNVNKLN